MTARRCTGPRLFVLSLMLYSGPGLAQPSLWDRARDPSAGQSYAVLMQVERLLAPPEGPFDEFWENPAATHTALQLLEALGAERLPEPRLWFLLGELYGGPVADRPARARGILERALQHAPDSPLAGRAWGSLGLARARLGDLAGAQAAYSQALSRERSASGRCTLLTRRAYASLRTGSLQEASRDAWWAVRSAPPTLRGAIAYYVLALIQERLGNLPSALDTVLLARLHHPSSNDESFWDEPAWTPISRSSRRYVRALEAMAVAHQAERESRLDDAQAWVQRAIGHWQEYLGASNPDDSDWLRSAALHQRWCERQRERLAQTHGG